MNKKSFVMGIVSGSFLTNAFLWCDIFDSQINAMLSFFLNFTIAKF